MNNLHKEHINRFIVDKMKKLLPSYDDNSLLVLYDSILKIHQQRIQESGSFFEKMIENSLIIKGIPFKTQVGVNHDGNICDRKDSKNIIDIIVGDDIDNGKHISNFKVISCKTTCRERWLQDLDWSTKYPPTLYVLITLSNDYPTSKRFKESPTRVIATDTPKNRDDRLYKLNIVDVINLLCKK